MASAKDFKKKIRTISNTKKITRTMEMVATVGSKRAQDRIKATLPYSRNLTEMLQSLAEPGAVAHPLIQAPATAEEGAAAPERTRPVLLLVVTANRGLCGGYNANVLSLAEAWIAAQRAAGKPVEIHMVGKKGMVRFRHLKISVDKFHAGLGEKATFKGVEVLAEEYMKRFGAGEVERIVVIATRFYSASVHRAAERQLLPIRGDELIGESAASEGPGAGPPSPGTRHPRETEFIFEPDRKTVVDSLIPLFVKNRLYRILLEAQGSEQVARRIAMKLATDNAEEMIRVYTQKYNRQRQAGITQQIMEIVGGSEGQE